VGSYTLPCNQTLPSQALCAAAQQVCRRDEPLRTLIAVGGCKNSWLQAGPQNPPSTGHVGGLLQALSSSTFGRKAGTSFINFKMLPLVQVIIGAL